MALLKWKHRKKLIKAIKSLHKSIYELHEFNDFIADRRMTDSDLKEVEMLNLGLVAETCDNIIKNAESNIRVIQGITAIKVENEYVRD